MLTSALTMSVGGQAPPSPTTISTSRHPISVASKSPTVLSVPVSIPVPVTAPGAGAGAVQPAANGSVGVNGNHASRYHHIWLVTGPAGCGKTTVAEYLADSLGIPYIEGDRFHPKANVEKMSNGIPLTDADRWDWLTALREESTRQIQSGYDGVVLTCSALKRKYRDVIRVAGYYDHELLLHFIYLDAPESVLLRRVAARQNHFFDANMVASQFNILEPPKAEEKDVIRIDVTRTIDEVKRDALAKVITAIEEADLESRPPVVTRKEL